MLSYPTLRYSSSLLCEFVCILCAVEYRPPRPDREGRRHIGENGGEKANYAAQLGIPSRVAIDRQRRRLPSAALDETPGRSTRERGKGKTSDKR